jgi:hypothetical protein
MKWNGQLLHLVLAERFASATKMDTSPVEFNVRLLAVETAQAHGIAFDEQWYALPLYTRHVMIAARVGRQWLTTLQEELVMK